MNKPHLLMLRELMDRVDRGLQIGTLKKFDIGVWVSSCGTRACALGWMCSDPEFMDLGWHMWHRDPYYTSPETGRTYVDYRGAEVFFGLLPDQSSRLFSPRSGNNTPRDMIESIDKLLKEEEKQ